ncbi:MAG: GNAT family N-acetyltransferase [Candidatus Bathyarchaeia archaeon]
MPPYSKSKPDLLSDGEDILIVERDGIMLGAVSVGSKDISFICGSWKESFTQCLDNLLQKIYSGWISKLYVFPEHRYQGVGTKLVEEAVKRLGEKNFTEAYAGIYIKNKFMKVSRHVFENNGFEKTGSCVCFLASGYCRGTLLRKTIACGKKREK